MVNIQKFITQVLEIESGRIINRWKAHDVSYNIFKIQKITLPFEW